MQEKFNQEIDTVTLGPENTVIWPVNKAANSSEFDESELEFEAPNGMPYAPTNALYVPALSLPLPKEDKR